TRFIEEHPEVLKEYRAKLEKAELETSQTLEPRETEPDVAQALAAALKTIPPGDEGASEYHSLMVGAVEFIFYPHLIYPEKEAEINSGRKRIDIRAENAARTGIFDRLRRVANIVCVHVLFECKNYSRDLKNPELDQMIGRFSDKRGEVGF